MPLMASIDVRVGALRRKVRVKAPLSLLQGPELETFLLRGYAPEICFESWDLDRMAPAQLRPLAEELRARELAPTVHGPFLGLDPGSPRDLDRDTARMYMEATVRWIEILRPACVVFHGGGLSAEMRPERERWVRASLEHWAWLAEALDNLGSVLALENVVDWEPEPLAMLLEQIPRAGWCLDIGHQRVFDRVGLEHWIMTLGPRLIHLHLHDNFGKGDDHLPLGQGTIDLARLFGLLAGFPEPTATFEVDHRTGVEQSLPVLAEVWPW